MITDLKPYPEYKESGLDWVGKLPSHWIIERGKWLFNKMERPVQENDDVVTCFRDGVVTLRKNRRTSGFTESLKEIGYQGIRKGDLVIHAMDAFAGAVGVADSDGKGTPVYSVCRSTSRVNAKYYASVVREMARNQWILALAKGIRERSTDFRYTYFAEQQLPVPSLPEQEAIVRFLIYLDQRIGKYIRSKRKLIKLLEEQRRVIIHQTVTHGLDPDVLLKSSGVEWLGDIPRHWELQRLKFLTSIKTGGRDTVDRKDDGEYPFFVRSQTIEHIDSYSFNGEAVLTAGDGAGVAKVFHYIVGKFDYHQRVYNFHKFSLIHGKFFFFYFSSTLRYEAFRNTAKSTVDSLRLPLLKNFPVLLPPMKEQVQIVEVVERKIAELDRSHTTIKSEIELLREFRTRLIADVVTGKIDVREAAANLPEDLSDYETNYDTVDPINENGTITDEMDTLSGEINI